MTRTLHVHDLVPAELRREWSATGRYPDRTLFALFTEHAVRHPDRAAVIDSDGTTTYAQLYAAALSFAAALRDAGVRPGDVVACQLPNSWRSCAVDLGAAAAGAVVLPYPPGRGRRETLALLGRSHAVAAVLPVHSDGFDYAATLDKLRPELHDLRTVFTVDGVHPGTLSGDAALERSAAFHPADPAPAGTLDGDPDGPVRILVSSGSEAEPKMVLYSHNALAGGRGAFMAGIRGDADHFRNLFLPPLGTSYGTLGTSVTIATHGGTLLLLRKFTAEAALRMLDEHRPTHVFAVPAMIQMMLGSPLLDTIDRSGLVAVVTGGSAIDTATIDECAARIGGRFVNLYGSADGVNSYTRLTDPMDKVRGTVGRPDPDVAVFRIIDTDGNDLPDGEIGELICRGPLSPMCYVNAPELDARYRTDGGWVRTGDLGYRDDEGYLQVIRRVKDIIIRGGRNISPVEIEQLTGRHPKVRAVCCVGVPDTRLGERIGIAVVPVDPANPPALADLTAYLAGLGLEQGKWPEELRLVDTLPLGPAGKVDKPAVAAGFVPAPVPAAP